MLEQLSLADTLIFYDDVAFSKGSFTNRVQIKTQSGISWMTVPIQHQSNIRIKDVAYAANKNWKKKHKQTFQQAYSKSKFLDEALGIMDNVYVKNSSFCELVMNSTIELMNYFQISPSVLRSSEMRISGAGSQRVLKICQELGADTYITGHGARQYLDHESFENLGINVHYMDYSLPQTPQLHGEFTPYVSTLDVIANAGPNSHSYLSPKTIPWQTLVN